MATSIPPHNLTELVDSFIHYVDNQDSSVRDLMGILKGPDFPTGGYIYGKESLINAYETGRGTVIVRAKSEIEETSTGKQRIIINEIPYQTNKSKILENIANLVKIKKINGISDLRDESDRDGMRIVIEIKRDELPEVVLNSLFKYTQLQTTFSINLLAIVNQQPKQFNLLEYFNHFLGHRKEIVRRRSLFELNKAEKRAHIIEGLKIALDQLDLVIKTIRSSKNREDARGNLMEKLPLSIEQTNAILDMQMYKLTGLEIDKLEAEYQELMKFINYLKELLSNEQMMLGVIKDELEKVKDLYDDKRRTELIESELSDLNMEDLIKDEDFVIIFTNKGYIKRTQLSIYKNQNRGTMGKKGVGLKDDDFISRVFVASAHEYILVFTDEGKMFWKKVYELPEGDTGSRGKPINRIIGISDDERVCSIINVKNFEGENNIMMFSRKGYVKKTPLSYFSRPRANGIIAASVAEDDKLFEAHMTSGEDDIILGTTEGKAIRFNEKDVRVMGRGARGVRGIKLSDNDMLVGADVIRDDSKYIITVTENGIGKKSEIELYRFQKRGGKGLINMKLNDRLGKVIGLVTLSEDEDLILSSKNGIINKVSSTELRSQGRVTQGVKLLNLRKGDRLVSLEKVKAYDEEEVIETEEEVTDNN